MQSIKARHFGQQREVSTGSWLGLRFHGQGIGTQMRAAVLHLAFDGLGAIEAKSGAYLDNPASLRISKRLGYRPDGVEREWRRGEAVNLQRLRLTRTDWLAHERPSATIEGLEPCLPLFGVVV